MQFLNTSVSPPDLSNNVSLSLILNLHWRSYHRPTSPHCDRHYHSDAALRWPIAGPSHRVRPAWSHVTRERGRGRETCGREFVRGQELGEPRKTREIRGNGWLSEIQVNLTTDCLTFRLQELETFVLLPRLRTNLPVVFQIPRSVWMLDVVFA